MTNQTSPTGPASIGVSETFQRVRLDALARRERRTVEAALLHGREVFHYSIPAYHDHGDGQIEDGSEIDSNKQLVDAEQVLVSRLNPRKGCVILARKHTHLTVASTEFVALTPVKITSRFLYWFMLAPHVRDFIESTVYSATRSHQRAEPDVISKMWVFVPRTQADQRHIADFLDRKTAEIDALIAKKERMIALLNEKRLVDITHAVTRGKNPTASLKDSGFEWLGKVPSHWTVKRLRHISPRIGVGLVINPSTYTRDEGVPFIFGADVTENGINPAVKRCISDSDSRMLWQSRLNPGDLITVRVGYPGLTAVVPESMRGANCASVMVIRKHATFDSAWLCHAMNSRAGRFQVERVQYGAAQEQFNIAHAINFVFGVPPVDEQRSIAKWIDAMITESVKSISLIERHIALLQEYRQALISEAVAGRVGVGMSAMATPSRAKETVSC